ncbi:MAG: ComF family protein [Pseudomonadota bacterium]
MRQLQRAVSLIYPDQCILCDHRVEEQGGLCGECWAQTPFLDGLVCDTCGVSLPGSEGERVLCDECLAAPWPWRAGRAAVSYKDLGRRVVLSLKHSDRLDLVPACASWMSRAGNQILPEDAVLVPVPAHWTRLLTRRYNQAVELSRGLAQKTGLEYVPDALQRARRTPKQDGMTFEERYANLRDAIRPNEKRIERLRGRPVCIIDDVMTSGATLTASTDALYEAGASEVFTLVLARVEKTP